MDEAEQLRFAGWLRERGIDSPRRVVRETTDAILVSKFESGFAANLHDALDRVPEVASAAATTPPSESAAPTRVEAWRAAIEAVLAELGPGRSLDRDQLSEIQAGVDSVAALLDSVLWTAPAPGGDWRPSDAERTAYAEALARMDDESSIFTRYYGDFEGRRVENHCPGAQVARRLFASAWAAVTGE